MTTAITFPSETSNFSLPLLFAGQAQKEFFINQAFGIIDSLLQFAIEDSLTTPPALATDGTCYRVLAPSTDEWSGKEGQLAVRIAGAWKFVSPRNGTYIFDRSADKYLLFSTTWKAAAEPTKPSGGMVVDTEARTAINELIQALRNTGALPTISP